MQFVFLDPAILESASEQGGEIVLTEVKLGWWGESGWEVKGPALRRHDALFRTFSEIEPTPAGVDDFARRFSSPWAEVELLGMNSTGRVAFFLPRCASGGDYPPDWRDQILDMRQCLRLWDLVRAGDDRGLARHIRWDSDGARGFVVHYDSHPDLKPEASPPSPDKRVTSVIASTDTNRTILDRLRPGDVRVPALIYIEAILNKHLDKLVRPRLLCSQLDEVVTLEMVPQNLITGMWLQFAQAVAEKKDYARCKACRAWFEVSLPLARNTRVYCSDVCKVRAYLSRKDKAVQLRARGMTVKEIAKELGTDKDTVKRWIGKKK